MLLGVEYDICINIVATLILLYFSSNCVSWEMIKRKKDMMNHIRVLLCSGFFSAV